MADLRANKMLVAHPRGVYHANPDSGLTRLTGRKAARIAARVPSIVANQKQPGAMLPTPAGPDHKRNEVRNG